MPPEEDPKPSNVISLAARRLEAVAHVRFEAIVEEGMVYQTIHHPDFGDVRIGYSQADLPRMIEGLVREGAKLSSERWVRWLAHVRALSPLPRARGRAAVFAKLWRAVRPQGPAPFEAVRAAAAALGESVIAGADDGTHTELSAEVQGYLGHLAYDGRPLVPAVCLCRAWVPWDLL